MEGASKSTRDMSHENDDSAGTSAAIAAEPKAEDHVAGAGTNDESSSKQLVSQADEAVDEIQQEAAVDPLRNLADRFLEQSSDGGSKSNLISRLNQGSKSGGRQKGRWPRGSMKMLIAGSSPSQPMKPYEADLTSADNENRSSSKKQAKGKTTPVSTVVYDNNNDPSTTRRQSQSGGDEENLVRRLVLADVTPSELNKRMGTTLTQTPEKYFNVTPVQVAAPIAEESSLILSLQRSVEVHEPGTESEAPEDDEETIESALGMLSMKIYGPDDDSGEHHDSDKENVPVTVSRTRQPLQTLYSAPPSPSDIFATPQQLNRTRYQIEGGRPWQMTVDTNCLLNTESLESLKRLNGVHETLLVIPSIVIRELDYLRRREESKARACDVLEWIERCMLEMPFWIHVQRSAESVLVAMTPVSSSIYTRDETDMMQPTVNDHVLECALFQKISLDGRVAVLTDDRTLKIKALAEGLVVDTANSFSDSLLNPYSERFVYSGSTPIRRSAEKLSDGFSTPRSTVSSSKWPALPRPTSRVNFSIWRRSQPIGLQVLLA